MKSCDVCGTINPKENNYCIHCGNRFVIEHTCPFCGSVNRNSANHCTNCGSQINPIVIDDFDILFSDYNTHLLSNAAISDKEYFRLVKDIFIRADYTDIYGNNIKERILSLASVFTECKTKSRGYERGYIFLDNCIYYDDRLDDSVQIATIIHELAHYFLFSIIENLLCHVFKVKTSPTLQSFIWYFSTLPELKIMNEYCAHTVEGRFVPFGYQNYGSFNLLVRDSDEEAVEDMVKLGNTFANEIILYLEKYISEDLRQDIKLQYRKDMIQPKYDSIILETNDSFPVSVKNSVMLKVLYNVFAESRNDDVRSELEMIREGIVR